MHIAIQYAQHTTAQNEVGTRTVSGTKRFYTFKKTVSIVTMRTAKPMFGRQLAAGPPQYTPPPATSQSDLMTLTFDLLTLEPVRNVSRGTDNLPANSGVSATFRCWVILASMRQTDDMPLLPWSWRHCACRWCGSSYSIPVPSSKFVCLPFRKIRCIFRLNINWPRSIDLWTSKWRQGSP